MSSRSTVPGCWLRHRWPGVAGLLILVEANRTGVELDLERLRDVEIIDTVALDRPGQLAASALLVLDVQELADHLDAEARAAVERGHDEGDTLTAARRARAAQAEGDAAADRDVATPQPRIEVQASVTFGDGDEAESESPFAALAGLRLEAPEQADVPDGER